MFRDTKYLRGECDGQVRFIRAILRLLHLFTQIIDKLDIFRGVYSAQQLDWGLVEMRAYFQLIVLHIHIRI